MMAIHCRTTLLVALRKADLAAIEATKTQAFNLLHADVLSSLPKGSTPSVAAVYLPPTSSQMSSGEAWAKALATGDETLQALGSRIAGLGRAPPAATGIINTRALLEKKFMGRQQSAAQGMLSMLQLRCDGARHCFEVRIKHQDAAVVVQYSNTAACQLSIGKVCFQGIPVPGTVLPRAMHIHIYTPVPQHVTVMEAKIDLSTVLSTFGFQFVFFTFLLPQNHACYTS